MPTDPALAHVERRLISERTKDGWRQIESMGVILALTPHRYQKSQSILVRISQIHRTLTGTDLFPTNFSGGKYR